MYFRQSLQINMSSLRLLKVAMCGLDIVKKLSVMHKLHLLVRLVYALAFARIFQVIINLSSFLLTATGIY